MIDHTETRFKPENRKADVGRQAQVLNFFGNMPERGNIAFGGGLLRAVHLQCFPTLPTHESRDASQQKNEARPHHGVDMRRFFQVLNQLRPAFHAPDGAQHHVAGQFHIDIAKAPVFAGGDDRFAHDMGQVRAHHEIHGQAEAEQCRPRQKTAAHSEKPSKQPDYEAGRHQPNRIDVRIGNGKIHFISPFSL